MPSATIPQMICLLTRATAICCRSLLRASPRTVLCASGVDQRFGRLDNLASSTADFPTHTDLTYTLVTALITALITALVTISYQGRDSYVQHKTVYSK